MSTEPIRIDVVSLFPDSIRALSQIGVVGRAQTSGLLQVETWNPRDFATDKHRKVDERTFGGGPGMVMMVEPLRSTIHAAKSAADGPAKVIYLSPQGERLTQAKVTALGQANRLVLLCGRYEGVDERLLQSDIDEEISIGDYVLSGGELAALVLIDAIGRLREGALGDSQSAAQDSFSTGMLDCPHYARPEICIAPDGKEVGVPSVLLSGDHAAIARWRLQQALGRTWLRRPDLLSRMILSGKERMLLDEFIRQHLHNQ